nr:6581_t:CDS:2 [Entrophospora candida]
MWEVEEDIELSQRISVCVIRPKIGGGGDAGDIDTEDSEYQLIQSQKHSTYAAAAKLDSIEQANLVNNNNNILEIQVDPWNTNTPLDFKTIIFPENNNSIDSSLSSSLTNASIKFKKTSFPRKLPLTPTTEHPLDQPTDLPAATLITFSKKFIFNSNKAYLPTYLEGYDDNGLKLRDYDYSLENKLVAVHIVKPSDTLPGIALLYGIEVCELL